jgi:hypothetical protein
MQSRFATLAMFAAVTFVVLLAVLHAMRPDLAPGAHMISKYGVGGTGGITAMAFFALATSFVALAAACIPAARGVLARVAVVMLLLAGVGAAIGGLFPMDPIGTVPAEFSASGKMHNVGFMLGVPGALLGVTLLSGYFWRRPEWQSSHAMLALTVAAVWLTMAIFGVSMAAVMRQGTAGPVPAIGWQNRALVLAWAVWVFLVAWRLRVMARRGR